MESQPNANFPFFLVSGDAQMKKAAGILATVAIIIFSRTSCEAIDLTTDTGKFFVNQQSIVPQRHRRFVPPINIPHRAENRQRREYSPRLPVRPTPRYKPSKPKPSRDNRYSNRKFF